MNKFILILTCLCSASFCGCWTKTRPAGLDHESDPFVTEGKVQFERFWTTALVKVVRIDTERVQGNLLRLSATLRNNDLKMDSRNFWVEIRTTFLDDKGHVLEQTNWEPFLIERRTVAEYVCTSMSSRAADYQIIIRKPEVTNLNKP